VAQGVIGIAFVQAVLVGLALLVAGVPWAGVLAMITLPMTEMTPRVWEMPVLADEVPNVGSVADAEMLAGGAAKFTSGGEEA